MTLIDVLEYMLYVAIWSEQTLINAAGISDEACVAWKDASAHSWTWMRQKCR